MNYFPGFVKMMVFVVLIVAFFLGNPALGELDLLAELSGREELVKWAGYGEEKLSTVVVGGKILCHGADANEKTSIHPHPVSGAMVAVFCGTNGKTKKSWAKGSTDRAGNFAIDLPSHLHGIPNLEKVCHVKVVHLPGTSPCRQACARKHRAIKLSSIGEGVRIYTTHSIHLIPHKHT